MSEKNDVTARDTAGAALEVVHRVLDAGHRADWPLAADGTKALAALSTIRAELERLREDAEAWRWLMDNLPEGFDGDGAAEALIAEGLAELARKDAELERLRENLAQADASVAAFKDLASKRTAERDAALAAIRETYAVIRDRLKSASMSVERSDNDHAAFDHAAGILRRALSQEEA